MGCLHTDCYKAPFLFGVIVKRVQNTRLDPAAVGAKARPPRTRGPPIRPSCRLGPRNAGFSVSGPELT